MSGEKSRFEQMYENQKVQGYARKLLQRVFSCFPQLREKEDDFLQDMWFEVSKALQNYNPKFNTEMSTFTCLVMQRILYKSVGRALNTYNHETFLDDMVNAENREGVEDRENTSRYVPVVTDYVGDYPLTYAEVADTLSHLSPVEQLICRMIMAGRSLNEICKELNLPHTSFYSKIMADLRLHFMTLSGM